MTYTDTDRDTIYLGETAYAEASDQGQEGIRGQIHSVINRHKAGKWYSRKTLAGTVMAAFAYSAMNTSDPNRVRAAETPMDDFTMSLCMAEAAAAIAGTTDDPTQGATHYYRQGTTEPSWVSGKNANGAVVAQPAIFTVAIKDHLFFRGVT